MISFSKNFIRKNKFFILGLLLGTAGMLVVVSHPLLGIPLLYVALVCFFHGDKIKLISWYPGGK